MGRHPARGQTVRDDECHVVAVVCAATDMVRQHGRGFRRQATAEIGAHQEKLPVGCGARNREHRQAEPGQIRKQARLIERCVHGITRAGMGKPKLQQRSGGERSAGARQRDAGGSEAAQIGPRFVTRFAGRFVGRRARPALKLTAPATRLATRAAPTSASLQSLRRLV